MLQSLNRFREQPYISALSFCLFALTIFRYYYIFTGPNGLSFDEAQYWQYSRHLDLSYYAKGPVIAWLIAFSTWIMGDTEIGVRFFAPLFLLLSSVYMYKIAILIFNDARTAFVSAMLIQIIPLFSVYGVVMTIDPPFIFFWILSLYLFWKAAHVSQDDVDVQSRFHESALFYWLALGGVIGLGFMTKYIMVLFYICALAYILTSRELRHWLKRKEPYLSILLSLVVISPVLIWNMDHDWVSLKHTGGHAELSNGFSLSMQDFFEFLGTQIGLITPLLFFTMIRGVINNRSSKNASQGLKFLFWFWVPVLVFFLTKSLHGKVQANWAMVAYITMFLASADYFLKKITLKKWEKIYFISAFCLALFITISAHYPAIVNLPPKLDSTARLRGWRELGLKIGDVDKQMRSSTERQVFVFSDYYAISSELAFYMPDKPDTYLANIGTRRMNQYDIWDGIDKLPGYDAIYVSKSEYLPLKIWLAFDSFEQETFTIIERNRKLWVYYIYKCHGFKGIAPEKFKEY